MEVPLIDEHLFQDIHSLLRKAIQGVGVHPCYLDEISSRYSGLIELIMNEQEYYTMSRMMIIDYSEYAKRYSNNQYSPLIQNIVAYINMDIKETLSLQNIQNMSI